MKNKLSIAVCGKFHYGHYVNFLVRDGFLAGFYFSHKISSLPGLPTNVRKNFPLKEYLLGLHLAIFKGGQGLYSMMRFYHWVWKVCAHRSYVPVSINLVMLHGNCLNLIRKAKRSGGLVVGEAVNMHPVSLNKVISSECERLGLEHSSEGTAYVEMLKEIDSIDYLLCPSRAVAESYIENGFPRSKTIVIPYGSLSKIGAGRRPIGTQEYKEKTPIKVISVAQVAIRKGHHHLLAAVAESECPSKFDLTFVGRGNSAYMECIKKIYPHFKHISHVPHMEIVDEIGKHDVFVLMSIEDGFAMVVIEALEAGVPVVVSKYAGASEVVARVGGGLVVDPNNHEECIAAIKACAAGRYPRRVGDVHTWEEYAADLADKLDALNFSQA